MKRESIEVVERIKMRFIGKFELSGMRNKRYFDFLSFLDTIIRELKKEVGE